MVILRSQDKITDFFMILDLGMSLEYIDCYCIIAGLILPPNSITALLVGIFSHVVGLPHSSNQKTIAHI